MSGSRWFALAAISVATTAIPCSTEGQVLRNEVDDAVDLLRQTSIKLSGIAVDYTRSDHAGELHDDSEALAGDLRRQGVTGVHTTALPVPFDASRESSLVAQCVTNEWSPDGATFHLVWFRQVSLWLADPGAELVLFQSLSQGRVGEARIDRDEHVEECGDAIAPIALTFGLGR